ncbi:MAG: hypothetical protein ACI8ZN_000274 [Bacteroidia bacterium]|jgi:hypothetical protein
MNRLPSSFRDPAGFVFKKEGNIYRNVLSAGQADYDALMDSGLYESLTKKGYLLEHDEVETSDGAYKTLKPLQIPFITYPYEWSYGQLKDAALLTLFVQKEALKKNMCLKDASAYNIQFLNGKPVFIDTLSFEPYVVGQPWVAYKQFCQHFLGPLALAAHSDIRCLYMLRTHIDGLPLDLVSALLPTRTRFKFSLATHIHIHAKTQGKYANKAVDVSKKGSVSALGMSGLIDNLLTAVKGLKWNPKGTEWGNYYEFTNYSSVAFDHKKDIVSNFIKEVNPITLWDLGANDGTFSRLASNAGVQTMSYDIDPIAVEKNYRRVRKEGTKNLLPALLDLTNPSPSIGWANTERDSIEKRGKVDVVMALALVHHLSISNNTPLDSVASYFQSLCKYLIIEFVPKGDSQVDILLTTRTDIFPNYTLQGFEKAFLPFFDVIQKVGVNESTRTMYLLKSKH